MHEVLPAEVGPSKIIAKSETEITEASCWTKFLKLCVRIKLVALKFSGL